MESKSYFGKIFLRVSHLPTILLIAGYLSYWIELYFIRKKGGAASPFAFILFAAFSIFVLFHRRRHIRQFFSWFVQEYKKQEKISKYFLIISFGLIIPIIIIAFYAHLLPPHLIQESDALNYHFTLPHQHLISGSFKHIRWSSADLFPLPVQFALAPYWFVTELPNKFPQFFFLIGLVLVAVNLVKQLGNNNVFTMCLMAFSIFGSHFLGIQIGTAMLDIVLCYLLFAALDSFLQGDILASAVEFTFFLWSKSFMPFQVFFIALAMLLLFFILKRAGFKDIGWGFTEINSQDNKRRYLALLKKMPVLLILFTVLIGGPFLIKSAYYSGTPLFPFMPGIIKINKNIDKNSDAWRSILASSESYVSKKDMYGYGRSPVAFIRHLFLIAVPEEGVNNRYDYPVGLPYLLFAGPFLYFLFFSLKKKQFVILPLFIIFYWISWWFGSHQTRFLYIPIFLIIAVSLPAIKVKSKIFMAAIVISLLTTGMSVFRAHRKDFGLLGKIDILREKDRRIVEMNKRYSGIDRGSAISLDYYDVAYAKFPVNVTKEELPWILSR
jgi:hypothetical protein